MPSLFNKLQFIAVLILVVSFAGQAADLTPIKIRKASGEILTIQAELALDYQSRAKGLMYREALADKHGMLFVFPQAREASFWMRNTLIPLDLIFIRTTGKIANIWRNARPLDEETKLTSDGKVIGVLELSGGAAKRYGIEPGDRVEIPGFIRRRAK